MIKITNQPQNNNPIVKLLLALGGIVTFGLTLLLGAVALFFILGFVVLVSSILAIRFWWIKRNISEIKGQYKTKNEKPSRESSEILEGEFHEVDKDKN
tara:strand:+ start:586 stop:879 length:294 start_codon:yes stop_codon:yes gene_type:complete